MTSDFLWVQQNKHLNSTFLMTLYGLHAPGTAQLQCNRFIFFSVPSSLLSQLGLHEPSEMVIYSGGGEEGTLDPPPPACSNGRELSCVWHTVWVSSLLVWSSSCESLRSGRARCSSCQQPFARDDKWKGKQQQSCLIVRGVVVLRAVGAPVIHSLQDSSLFTPCQRRLWWEWVHFRLRGASETLETGVPEAWT